MKIAFDGQLFFDSHKTGIAWNAHNLLLELAKYPENICTIQCFVYRCSAAQIHRLKEYRDIGCHVEYCRWFKYSWYKLLWTIIPFPHRFFFSSDPDITQFFNFAVPPGVKGRRISFVHDMAYKSCPWTVDKRTRIWLELSLKRSCRHADHIVTVSEFSRQEIIRYLNIPKEKITVVPNAVDHEVYHASYTEKQVQMALDKYQIEQEYFLYLGTIEPRKNLEILIDAYAELYRAMVGERNVPQLVLAGKKGWLCEGIYEKAHRLHIGNKILFTGYVTQEDSPVLMCGAMAFVFPSLYEGFGMPPLEAMACGTPVITSNLSSLPEVVGDAAITVNPKSKEEICEAMRILLEDDAYRRKLSEIGIEKAAEYTWAKSAQMLMDVYRGLCD